MAMFRLKAIKSRIIANDNLSGLAVRDAPLGDGWATTARNDDPVTFAGDGRQGDDAVEPKKANAHTIQIATYNKEPVKISIYLADNIVVICRLVLYPVHSQIYRINLSDIGFLPFLYRIVFVLAMG